MFEHKDCLSDSEKFRVIIQKYVEEYTTQESLALEMKIPKQSISDWKKHNRTIRLSNRNKISKKFRLAYSLWTDNFDDMVNFEALLEGYRMINTKSDKTKQPFEKMIIKPIKRMNDLEKALLLNLKNKQNIMIKDEIFHNKNAEFYFELSKILKSKNQIHEALNLLLFIQEERYPFSYVYHNEIEHQKAILYSHESINDWDESIHILTLLYKTTAYHLKEAEIITLLASNMKRKALSFKGKKLWKDKESVDMDALSNALLLYREAYELKNGVCYYDAINFAYLYNISKILELENKSCLEIKELYDSVKKEWIVNPSNWWEVSSDAEFLMLIGQVDLAIMNISYFLENHSVEKFNIEATLRQLELYIHFSNDKNAKVFYAYLKDSWHTLKDS